MPPQHFIRTINANYVVNSNCNCTAIFEFYCIDFRVAIICQYILTLYYFITYDIFQGNYCFSRVYHDERNYFIVGVNIHRYTDTSVWPFRLSKMFLNSINYKTKSFIIDLAKVTALPCLTASCNQGLENSVRFFLQRNLLIANIFYNGRLSTTDVFLRK